MMRNNVFPQVHMMHFDHIQPQLPSLLKNGYVKLLFSCLFVFIYLFTELGMRRGASRVLVEFQH